MAVADVDAEVGLHRSNPEVDVVAELKGGDQKQGVAVPTRVFQCDVAVVGVGEPLSSRRCPA